MTVRREQTERLEAAIERWPRWREEASTEMVEIVSHRLTGLTTEEIAWVLNLSPASVQRSLRCFYQGRSKRPRLDRSGLATHPIHDAWRKMLDRCYKPHNDRFQYYGARGITVCDRWRESFMAFYGDVRKDWKPGLTLDRIDPHGHYEPGNVLWATYRQQSRNRRNVRLNPIAARVIRWGRANGISGLRLARAYGITASQVYDIAKGRTWVEH